ncbi:MAG: hypothetical protein EPN40_03950 [Rhodanobacteraceae bacterium]|nr:MAG: hypothetical protein EPN40_03950 [Rhodanobacteraceae bacterium]
MKRRLATIVLAVLWASPLLLLTMLSISRRWAWPHVWPTAWQWTQWAYFLRGRHALLFVFLMSVSISITVAVISTVLAFPTSRAIARHGGRSGWLALAHLPFAVSPVVLGVALLYGFLRLGLAGHAVGVMLAQSILAYAYGTILLHGFWSKRINAFAVLAETLGATPWQRWSRVLVPIARPVLAICLFQTFLVSWFDFALVLLVGGGRVTTLTLQLYEYVRSGDIRLAATCALLLAIPPLVVLAASYRVQRTVVATNVGGFDGR